MLFFSKSTFLISVASFASAAIASNIHTVEVAQNGLSYSPDVIEAEAGDKIEFIFEASAKHSVAQAAFHKPCQPISDEAFFSGAITSASAQNVSICFLPIAIQTN